MASFNKVILIGNLTADPELKQTAQGTSVCSFTLAINRRFQRNADQGQPTADFISVVAWRERAEFIPVIIEFRVGEDVELTYAELTIAP